MQVKTVDVERYRIALALFPIFNIWVRCFRNQTSFSVINHNLVLRCVELLIAYDANINHAADEGQTPLYLACKNGNKECIKLLLEAGTDRSVETRVSTSFFGGGGGLSCILPYLLTL